MRIQRHYKIARAQSLELVYEAVDARATHNEARDRTGLLDHVKSRYARKLAHMWHGPFRVAELLSTYAVRLDTDGTPYQLFIIVHV
ncbi:hypothetical protein PHMEG_0001418 [Phytophthora megakarya]|uniref:Reverse transcriptase n=1 Tax=Phytophthora megakarya TaxID=4795 RepID=A0A225X1A8_9STRA|nr:hypothetical protein PHMEG_0001418 [Phytophthora megakarya]